MSAYIVPKITIDRIINGMEARRKELTYTKGIPALPIDDNDKTAFGQLLLDMNVRAVDQRYDEHNDREIYKFSVIPVTPIQAIKSLRNLLYQCSEGDVPGTELYKQMEQLGLELAMIFVEDLPSYDSAEWG